MKKLKLNIDDFDVNNEEHFFKFPEELKNINVKRIYMPNLLDEIFPPDTVISEHEELERKYYKKDMIKVSYDYSEEMNNQFKNIFKMLNFETIKNADPSSNIFILGRYISKEDLEIVPEEFKSLVFSIHKIKKKEIYFTKIKNKLYAVIDIYNLKGQWRILIEINVEKTKPEKVYIFLVPSIWTLIRLYFESVKVHFMLFRFEYNILNLVPRLYYFAKMMQKTGNEKLHDNIIFLIYKILKELEGSNTFVALVKKLIKKMREIDKEFELKKEND